MNWLEFNFRFPDWQDKVLKALPEIRLFIAAQMQTNRGLLFDSEGARNSHQKWRKPLFRSGMALSARGTLRKSIGPMAKNKPIENKGSIVRFHGDSITIGTNLMMARLMNDGTVNMPGGKLVPVHAQALKIPLPGGKRATSLAKNLRKGASSIKTTRSVTHDSQKEIKSFQRFSKKLQKSGVYGSELQSKLNEYAAKVKKKREKKSVTSTQKVLFLKSVKIPERPFDTWTAEDQDELDQALANKIAQVVMR